MSEELEKPNGHSLGSRVIDALMAEPDFIPSMRDAIMGGLRAHAAFFDKAAKEWTERPDHRSRLDAAKLALAYGEGLPLQRIMQQTLVQTRGELRDMLRESPEMVKALETELAKARFRTRNRRADPPEVDGEIEPPAAGPGP